MLTPEGTIKARTAMDVHMQKEMSRSADLMSLAMIIVGSIGIAVFLVLEILSVFIESFDAEIMFFMLLFAVFLGLGIGIKVLIKNALKNVSSTPKINEYEFFKDFFTVDQTVNGENVAHVKIMNAQVTKAKESKGYIALFAGGGVYPVAKDGLSDGELNIIRGKFRLPTVGAQTVETVPVAPADDSGSAQKNSDGKEGAEDPFGEFEK